jgi:hypothetical protein
VRLLTSVLLAIRLTSPDGAYVLFGDDKASQLWLENTRTHQRRMVFKVTVQTLSLAWSPDSAAFIANDRESSDREFAYIYDVKTLERLDLLQLILKQDPTAARFVPSQTRSVHSYVHGTGWLDAQHIGVRLHGHTDGPVDCFDLRYRVDRDGQVQKLSERVFPVTPTGCDGAE